MKISFVTTIYRTAKDVEPFAERAAEAAARLGFDHETIFVNDGSPDDGFAVASRLAARDPRVTVIDLSRNHGQHRALWSGIERADGDLVAVLDGDLEDDPLWIVEFCQTLAAEQVDVVYGVQAAPKGNPIYRVCRRSFYRMLDVVSDLEFPRNATTARVMSRRYVNALLSFEESELWLTGVMHVVGFEQRGMLVDKRRRAPSKYGIWGLVRLFVMAVTSFSITPLIGVFLAGIAMSIAAFLLIGYLVIHYFVTGRALPGWTSLMAVMMLFCGVLTLFNGLIAIYVGTIFLEVKRRPRAIVRSIVASEQHVGDMRA